MGETSGVGDGRHVFLTLWFPSLCFPVSSLSLGIAIGDDRIWSRGGVTGQGDRPTCTGVVSDGSVQGVSDAIRDSEGE